MLRHTVGLVSKQHRYKLKSLCLHDARASVRIFAELGSEVLETVTPEVRVVYTRHELGRNDSVPILPCQSILRSKALKTTDMHPYEEK